ncbi:MAG: efflux RND transporter periplasmic adaptor subunit [bacterium]
MSRKGKYFRFFTIINIATLVLIVITTGCSQKGGNGRNQYRTTVNAIVVETKDATKSLTVSGKIEGQHDVMLSFKSGGRVGRVEVDEGDTVYKNDLIASLEQTDYYATYLQAQTAFNQAEADFQRTRQLYEENLISTQAFQQAETGLQNARASLMLAQSAMQGAYIRAPFDGIIALRNIDVMEMASPGVPYFQVVDMDTVRIKLSIGSEKIGLISEGTEVNIRLDARPGEIFTGVVDRVFPAADPSTGKFTVEVQMENTFLKLLPGMIAICNIIIEKYEGAIVVPLKSVLMEEEQHYVFTVVEGVAHRTNVEVINVDDSVAVIASGLSALDTLVITGQDYIEDGSLVTCNLIGCELQDGDEQ